MFRSFKREEYELHRKFRKFNKSDFGYIWHHNHIRGQGKSSDTNIVMELTFTY